MKKIGQLIKKNTPGSIIGIITIVIVMGILLLPNNKKTTKQVDLSEYSSVNAICELATLRGFYHNVAMYTEEPGGGAKFFNDVIAWPFGGFIKTGYKQLWIEYSGIVEAGIKAGEIQINSPSADGVVEVFVPDAQILSVYADESSLSEPISEKGLFTTISGEEEAEAFATAQSVMRQEAENDQELLDRAKNNAKLILEQYIINTGKEMGVEYSVKWIKKPL
ncbi:MAG: DUF4230 domain-containing protein [Blautia sp.]|nr:DUF4230 domain-containing protein [Blautia sp.]